MKKGKKTKLGQELIESLTEAIAYHRGEITLKSADISLPDEPPEWTKDEITALRVKKLRVSQPIFARMIGVTPAALRSWEQGVKNPSGSARRLLQIVEKNPTAFMKLADIKLSEDEMIA